MKNLLLLFLSAPLLFACSSVKRPVFEGKITYRITVSSPTNSPFADSLQNQLGHKADFYYKNGDYRLDFNGKPFTKIIYKLSTNKQYCILSGKDTIFIDDCNKDERRLLKSYSETTNEQILEKDCEKFVIEMSKDTFLFYYSPDLYIPSQNFKKHQFCHFNTYYKYANAPYLKFVKLGRVFHITYEAIEIETKQIEDDMFSIPVDLPHSSFKEKMKK